MLNLVRWVCWRRRILTLTVVDRLLIAILLFGAVMSYRPSGHRSCNESSTSSYPSSSHSHGGSLRSLDGPTSVHPRGILVQGIGCVNCQEFVGKDPDL